MLGAQHITYVLPQIELTPFQLTPLGTLLGALCMLHDLTLQYLALMILLLRRKRS